ncbi:L,D-transpeptidase family protein [Pelagerythrobacter sp.]|uniref:L,D-transpeptidase family protein n=1 Tax=Pelagerythrobacter sp. TaxID=2800702 RepID=UPI0035B3277B
MRHLIAAASLLALSACGFNGTDPDEPGSETAASAERADGNLADAMASHDPGQGDFVVPEIRDTDARPMMQVQVVLDRQGFGPGVIDGRIGLSTENALRGFQEANTLEVTGELDDDTRRALARWDNIPATRIVRIPESWGALTFAEMPEDPADQAELDRLGYETLDEKLAERFHTTVEVLRTLNPGGRPAGAAPPDTPASPTPTPTASDTADAEPRSTFAAGQLIRVPNIGADRIQPGAIDNPDWQRTLQSLGVGSEQPEAARVVVSKSKGTLRAYNADDKLVALFTVTSGSQHDPLPLGEWDVNGISFNPKFAYDPALFWDVPDHEEKQQLPPGPNSPVGVVWIDLSKDHYGIHGTPEPQAIGRTQSHGCVRLTNWDAARLAEMVTGRTNVLFEA